jgi:hypothetical protein
MGFAVFSPSANVLANGSSELNRTDPSFKGSHPTQGVNPANGSVIYYHLPEAPADSVHISLEIRDLQGRLIRSFSSRPDTAFKAWDGGPAAEPVLPKAKGLNRFVWDMRHATLPGIPGVYLEASFRGHKVPPGRYSVLLKMGAQTVQTEAEILPNPLYSVDAKTYADYDALMSEMESKLTGMHRLVNTLHAKRGQLEVLLAHLPKEEKYQPLLAEGRALSQRLKAWDEEMVQRKSKAYDDVENFPNRFTAEYLFLINQTESDLPRPNMASRERKKELDAQWEGLEARGKALLEVEVPAFNRRAWDLGVGAVWGE